MRQSVGQGSRNRHKSVMKGRNSSYWNNSHSSRERTSPDKKTKVLESHAMAIRDKNKGGKLRHKLEDKRITKKEFGADDNQGKESQTWKNRETDWYNAERRFIFAADTKRKRNHWIEQFIKVWPSKRRTEGVTNYLGDNLPKQ